MITNEIRSQTQTSAAAPRRRRLYISGLVLRVCIALVISWLIVMAFFVTGVVSH